MIKGVDWIYLAQEMEEWSIVLKKGIPSDA